MKGGVSSSCFLAATHALFNQWLAKMHGFLYQPPVLPSSEVREGGEARPGDLATWQSVFYGLQYCSNSSGLVLRV